MSSRLDDPAYRAFWSNKRLMSAAEVAGATVLGLLFGFLILLASATVAGLSLRYSVNHWLVFAHKPPNFPAWPGFIAGFLPRVGPRFAGLCLFAAIATFLARFFV